MDYSFHCNFQTPQCVDWSDGWVLRRHVIPHHVKSYPNKTMRQLLDFQRVVELQLKRAWIQLS